MALIVNVNSAAAFYGRRGVKVYSFIVQNVGFRKTWTLRNMETMFSDGLPTSLFFADFQR